MPLFALALAVTFWPGSLEPATVPRWALASAVIPFLVLRLRRVTWTWGHCLFAGWLAYAGLSVLWSPVAIDAVGDLWTLGLMFGAFVIGAECDNSRRVWICYAIGVSVSSVLAIAQTYGYTGIQQVSVPAGLFMNRDLMAESAVVALAFGELPIVLMLALLPAAILAHCRSALVALVVMAMTMTRLNYYAVLLTIAAAVWLAVTGDYLNADAGVFLRLGMWRDSLAHLTFYGHGIGAFHALYPLINSTFDLMHSRPEHPHNEMVDLLFELGIGSVFPLALVLWLGHWRKFAPVLVLLGLGFGLHYPTTALMVAFGAGALAHGRAAVCLRRPSWAGGLCPIHFAGGHRS